MSVGFRNGGLTFRSKSSTQPSDPSYLTIFNQDGTLKVIDENGTITPLTPTIEPSLTLGTTSATAYYGDKGNEAYLHSQTLGNPHNTSASQISSTSGNVQTDLTTLSNLIDQNLQDISSLESITSTLRTDVNTISGSFPLSASEIVSTGKVEIVYETILGKSYKTISMPDGKQWLAENLSYADYGEYWNNAFSDDGDGTYSNPNQAGSIDSQLTNASSEWRVAKKADYDGLLAVVSGSDLIAKDNGGNDIYNFDLHLGGMFIPDGTGWAFKDSKAFLYVGIVDPGYPTFLRIDNTTNSYQIVDGSNSRFNLRLVKDTPAPIPNSDVQEDLDYLHANKADRSELNTLSLGELSTQAFRGDYGKTAYDHALTDGNPHQTAIDDIPGLSSTLDTFAPASTTVDLTSTQEIDGSKNFTNFIYLGENGPGMKTMMVRGTTASVQGGSVFLLTYVPLEQVVSCNVIVYAANEGYIPNTFEGFAGVQYSVAILDNQIQVRTSSTNSANILECEVKAFIIYSNA